MPPASPTPSKGFHDERYRALIETLVASRRAQGLSQQDVAGRLGRHQQHVSRYETGERRLDVVEFVDVAYALGLDPSELIAGVKVKS